MKKSNLFCPKCGARLRTDGQSYKCKECDFSHSHKRQYFPNDRDTFLVRLKYGVTDTGCWECISHRTDKDGYAIIYHNKKRMAVSRYVYMKLHGEIPRGMVVMHTCDNPRCINPDHLTIGTQADNIRDRDDKGRGWWQKKG